MLSEYFASILLSYYFVRNILKSAKWKYRFSGTSIIALIAPFIIIIVSIADSSIHEFDYLTWGIAFVLLSDNLFI